MNETISRSSSQRNHRSKMEDVRWLLAICFAFAVGICRADDDLFPLLMPKVNPTMAETYLCTPIRLNEDKTHYVIGFKPNATSHTAHHILVYGCEEPGSEADVYNCGEMSIQQPGLESHAPCKTGSQIIYAWAKDAPTLDLPKDVGFRVGGDSKIQYLVLQVHYAHIDMIPETGDDSGVFLHFTEEEQPKTAGVILLGTGGLAPPHTTTFFETACPMEDPRIIHPLAFRVHTHGLGKVVSGWKVTEDSKWTLIGKRSPQLAQMFYPVDNLDIKIGKGDVVAARCTMVNDKDESVEIGATNNDEMCNFYMLYWVEGKYPVDPQTCFSPGPPHWSWATWGLKKIPEEEASTL